jgi:hypothetical protein
VAGSRVTHCVSAAACKVSQQPRPLNVPQLPTFCSASAEMKTTRSILPLATHRNRPILRFVLCPAGKEWLEAESLIASALQRAKYASSLGLQLSTYRSYPACAGAVLQWLPTYYMRTLELGPRAEYSR